MKLRTVGIVSGLAMMLTSVTVWSLTPKGGPAVRRADDIPIPAVAVPAERWTFTAGKTLTVEGRLGHSALGADRGGESYVFVDVKPAAGAVPKQPPPLAIAIAIDKSGSMSGKRLRNAIDAARGTIARLHDGDVASIVTYSDRAELLVPSTTIDAATRAEIERKLASIFAGGETCISCGLDTAMAELRGRDDMVKRILVLSDGEPTVGAKDPAEFVRQAERARDMGCSITTIGVDVDYNEKVMSAIARGSNGRHMFVENASQLAQVFDGEARALADTVATRAELRLELAPDVDVVQVFDRAFRREGNTLVVPLGSFSAADDKTLLVKFRVRGGAYGEKPIADVRLTFRDFVDGGTGDLSGKLALQLTKDGQASPLDPLVAGRAERVETASVLVEANERFAQGDVAGAKRLVESKRAQLKAKAEVNTLNAPLARKDDVERDFGKQEASLDQAATAFAAPPPPAPAGAPAEPVQATRSGKAAVKRNQQIADEAAF